MNMTFPAMYDESERGKRVWMQEYFLLGKFCNAYQREANILTDAVRFALNSLQEDAPDRAAEVLKKELNKATNVRLDAVKPLPARLDHDSVAAVFADIAQAEGFPKDHPLTKRFEALFKLGAIVGFNRCQQGLDSNPPSEPPPVNYVELMKEIQPPAVKRRLLDDEVEPAPKRRLLLED